MATLSELVDLSHASAEVVASLESASRNRVDSIFARFEAGVLSGDQLRDELLDQVSAAFTLAAATAGQQVRDLANLSGVTPPPAVDVSTSSTLRRLLLDIRLNISKFLDSGRTETDLRRLRFRSWLSVQGAYRFGLTEGLIASASDLEKQGAVLKKIWMTNVSPDHSPCAHCLSLHGTERSLHEEFDHGGAGSPNLYVALAGPPRHPNCRCYIILYVATLDTVISIQRPSASVLEDQFMSSKDVKRLPKHVFVSVVTTMRLIAGKLKGAIRGKR